MKLSIIVPVYNEVRTLRELIEKVNKVDINKEIILVDDGSTDGSKEILKEYENEHKVIYHKKNKGKGSAIRTGLKEVTGDFVTIQDADLELDPNDFLKLIKVIEEEKAEIVYGARDFKGTNALKLNTLANSFLTFMTNLLYSSNIKDEATCYKVFKTDIIKNLNLKCKGFEFCPEVTAKVLKQGYKIYDVTISYFPRDYAEDKKIRWKDGFIALWTLLKYRFKD